MSNVLEFTNTITSLGTLDADVVLKNPLQLPQISLKPLFSCLSVTLSNQIPNVYNATTLGIYQWNNTLAKIRSTAHSWITVQMPTGIYYTPEDIALAINNVANQYAFYTTPTDPALTITGNTITGQVVIRIDDTKMKVGEGSMSFDIRAATVPTDLATTLGFDPATALFSGTGVWASSVEPRMDTQGTEVDVQCSIAPQRHRNGEMLQTIANINFSSTGTAPELKWPSAGEVVPEVFYSGSRVIDKFRISFKTIDGRPMLFLYGRAHIVMQFTMQ